MRQSQLLDVVTQAFADLALDFVSMIDNTIGTVVLIKPLGGSLGTNARHAWNVVRGIADQCQIVDDLFGIDVELFLNAFAGHDYAAHRIDQRHVIVDELRHILVAR